MRYKTLPYRTADDINRAEAFVFRLRNKYKHVAVIMVNALQIVVEYRK